MGVLTRMLEAADRKDVAKGLDDAYGRAKAGKPFDIQRDRMVIFSDMHRGARDGADDFRICERAYNAALAYYFRMGHTLVILGDAEELWEETPAVAVKASDYTLRNEARFHQAERYLRFWGNHDDDWRYPEVVRKHLEPIFGGPLDVHEAMRIPLINGAQRDPVGELFLTHGHQGTGNSDKNASLSKAIVRYFWRPVQRLSGWSFNTPSGDFRLREQHGLAMYAWAAQRTRTALIAGHTHAPVFRSLSHGGQLKEEIEKLEAQLKQNDDPEIVRQLSEMVAKLEWMTLKATGRPEEQEPDEHKPCYFNAGCCAYPDGDITGIELAEGEIRLVRWPDESRQPRARIMARAKLQDVFAELD
jgi:predicted phosphodiesterase